MAYINNKAQRRPINCNCSHDDPDCSCAGNGHTGVDGAVNVNVILDSGNTTSHARYSPRVDYSPMSESYPVFQPYVANPYVVQPNVMNPTMVSPTMVNPTMVTPSMIQPQMVMPIVKGDTDNQKNYPAAPPLPPVVQQEAQQNAQQNTQQAQTETQVNDATQAKTMTQKIKEWFAPIQSADNRLVDTGYNPKKRVWNFSPEWV